MSSTDTFWDRFKGQTILKHFVLTAYLGRWAAILGRSARHLWYVDAFAGRGKDEVGHDGSPLMACKTLRGAVREAESKGQLSPAYHVEAIEAKKSNYLALCEALAGEVAVGSPIVRVHHGTLEDRLDELLNSSAGAPLLIFIDPFGVKGLSADVVRRALSAPKAELLILFNDTGANRLHGAVVAQKRSRVRKQRNTSALPDLFGNDGDGDRDADADDGAPEEDSGSAQAWEATAPASEEILTRAFGNDAWRDAILSTNPRRRPRRWLELYVERLHELGAKFVLPFSIRDDEDAHVYYLIHASQNVRAFVAMKDAIRRAMNLRRERIGQQTLGFETSSNVAIVAERVLTHFKGRQHVRWADGHNSSTETVQGYAISATDALYADMADLKERLQQYAVLQRPLTYSFP